MKRYIASMIAVAVCFVLLSGCTELGGKANLTNNTTSITNTTTENTSYNGAGYIPDFNDSYKERQSKIYWASAFPITIRDYVVTPTGAYFIIENVADNKIELASIYLGEEEHPLFISNAQTNFDINDPSGIWAINISSTKNAAISTDASKTLTPGESKLFVAPGIVCRTENATYELSEVSFTYDVVGGISNITLAGDRPMYGRCKTS